MKKLLALLTVFIISSCATTMGIALAQDPSYAVGYTNKTIQEAGSCLQNWDGYRAPIGIKGKQAYNIFIPQTETTDYTLGGLFALYVITESKNESYETQIDFKRADNFDGSMLTGESQPPMSYLRACTEKVDILLGKRKGK